MRTIFLGTPNFSVPSLEALVGAGHDVACVVTQPDRPSGRRRCLTPPPVKVFAESHGLPVRQTDDVNAPDFVEALAALRPEAIVVAAFGQALKRPLLNLPPLGCINVHFSLLPRHRGAAPVAHAILCGDPETGVTLMRMVRKMDAGDILSQAAVPVGATETTGQLTERLGPIGARLLVETLDGLAAGRIRPVAQDPSRVTFAPSFDKSFGAIEWARPAKYLSRFVRAMNPWPGAFTFWHGSGRPPLRLVIHEAAAAGGEARCPGRVALAAESHVAVETGEGLLHVLRLQPAGGRAMAVAEFLRGHPLQQDEMLGPELEQ